MNIEKHSPLYELKAAQTDAQGLIEGYASTFGGEPDAYGDVIAAGAYSKSLAEHKRRETRPAMFWAHDQSEPIGKWLELREDDQGLRVQGKFSLATRRGGEAYALAKDDALGLSIGYRIPNGGADYENGIRELKEIDLLEVSVVGLPASHTARITSVKSALSPDLQSPKAVERALRELGMSGREAKRFMAGGYKAFMQTEDNSAEVLGVLESINSILRK